MTKNDTYSLISVKLINTFGDEYELKNLMVMANIYEDLFSSCTTAVISISDSVGLIETLPIIGEEHVEIEFYLDEKDVYSHRFALNSIEQMINESDRLNSYDLHLVSEAAIINEEVRLQKFYSGKSTDHVRNICTNILGISNDGLFTQESENTKEIVVPNMKPFDYINYLASNSVVPNTENEAANYIFYENRYRYAFVSLEKLMEQPSKYTYIFNSSIVDKSYDGFTPFEVNQYHFDNMFNEMKNINNGMYANRVYSHNIITKEYGYKDYSYKDSFSLTKHTESTKPVKLTTKEHRATSKNMFIPTNVSTHPSYTYPITTGKRASQISQFDNYILNIDTTGETYSTVGDKVTFAMPSITRDNDTTDKLLSGDYLVTRKRYILSQLTISSILELRKESFRGA